MPLSAPEYWLEWTKNYFRCQFTHVGELIHKETWSAASFGWAEGLQMINPPIYRLTTAVSDIDQTNINRDIRDGNWLSRLGGGGEGGWSDLDIIPCAWHPRVRRCLSKCVPPLHKGEAWGVGRWCGWLEGGAETDPCKKLVLNNFFCAKTSTIMFQIVTHLKCGLSVSVAGLIQTSESL